MSRVVIVWKYNCPKCDYLKNLFAQYEMSKGIDLQLINGEKSEQTFLKEHDINLLPMVLFYNDDGQVTKAAYNTARKLNELFKEHTGKNLFKYFA